MGNPVPRFPSDEPSATPSGFTPRRVQRPARITRQDRYRVQRTYRGLRSARSARIAAQIARNSASIQPTTSDQSLMQQQPSCDEPETTSPSNRELTNPPSHQVDANGLPTLHGLPVGQWLIIKSGLQSANPCQQPRDYDVYSLEEALELGTRRLTFMGKTAHQVVQYDLMI